MGIINFEFAIHTDIFMKKFNSPNSVVEYGYFRSNVFHVFSGVVPVTSDFIMATMYFTSAVGLYTTRWHKKLIILFVLVASAFISVSLYVVITVLISVAS